jgi:hypothetical protein
MSSLVEPIRPRPPWTDLVRPAPLGRLGAERPRSVRICAVPQPVHVQAVRDHVAVKDVDVESLAGTRVDHGSRHAVRIARFVHIGKHQLVRFWYEVVRVEVFSIDHRIDAPGLDFRQRNRRVLVPAVAVSAVSHSGMRARLDRAVTDDLFDLQVDVPDCHGDPLENFSDGLRSLCAMRGVATPSRI